MAENIRIGQPVNAAETWAFEFLKKNLPSEYLLITNVEIPTPTGVLKEVDALVFGKHAIYIIDVKGYHGRLSVDANSWFLDNMRVDNALAKVNGVARVYAGQIKSSIMKSEHAPWCQGMVFVTGREGTDIEISKSQENFSIFGPQDIIKSLTDPAYCTTEYPYEITAYQRKKAIEVLGNIGKIPNSRIGNSGFQKVKKLGTDGTISIWSANHEQGELLTEWILREVDTTATDTALDIERLVDQAARLEQLSGVLGVPVSAPLVNEKGFLSLPIKRPQGCSLSSFLKTKPNEIAVAKTLRFALNSIEQINSRGLSLATCEQSNILISEDCEVTFYADFIQHSSETTADTFKRLFADLATYLSISEVGKWFSDVNLRDIEAVKFHLTKAISGISSSDKTDQRIDEPFSGRVRLNVLKSTDQESELWSATHLTGRFDCEVEKFYEAEVLWSNAQARITALMQAFHPNLQRIFDIDFVNQSDCFAVCKSSYDGLPFEVAYKEATNEFRVSWFRQILRALNYLHNNELYHGRFTIDAVAVDQETVQLCNASLLVDTTLDVQDAYLNDLKRFWYCILSLQFACAEDEVQQHLKFSDLNGILSKEAVEAVSAFLERPYDFDLTMDYLKLFMLEPAEAISELDETFIKKWSISSGYMTFLVLDLLNDLRPKSRNQIVLNALRSRKIPGNKTNKSSMSSAVSRLKSNGIAEDHGKKIRLTNRFVEDWQKDTRNNQ